MKHAIAMIAQINGEEPMSTNSAEQKHPFAGTAMVKFLTKRIDELKPDVTQREIARRLGYTSVNFVSMMKTGAARVSLEKLPALAEILGVDPAHLVRLGLEQYWRKLEVVSRVLPPPITKNERAFLRLVRKATNYSDPEITAERQIAVERALTTAVASPGATPA